MSDKHHPKENWCSYSIFGEKIVFKVKSIIQEREDYNRMLKSSVHH